MQTMNATHRAVMIVRAYCALIRYDFLELTLGIPGVAQRLPKRPIASSPRHVKREQAAVDAFTLATCLYWKPVRCLQRAICLVRVLRASHVDALVVIGYRPAPFQSHAWVEIHGRVVNDSPAYRERLRVLRVA
jgi:hypothetical protein